MSKIESTAHIAMAITDDATSKIFFSNLNSAIDGMQNKGLTVEVQYQVSGTTHVAVVLGRRADG